MRLSSLLYFNLIGAVVNKIISPYLALSDVIQMFIVGPIPLFAFRATSRQ